MFLHLLSEKDLRFRIEEGWAEVFFKANPDEVIGRRQLEQADTILHFDEAWEEITKEIGPIMPADLVEEKYIKLFDGIAYLSNGFSCCKCPKCSKELNHKEVQVKESIKGKYFMCPGCHKKIKLRIWSEIPREILKGYRRKS